MVFLDKIDIYLWSSVGKIDTMICVILLKKITQLFVVF